ncbi:hypothetical protein RRG08_056948 [Elysia crispata]|uniref:C2H2-type domain-containing protein n=1 Tax=Elysia crispata TaxID=231223 RepID=A0AAE1CT21_9GAST|nr:hypothetical protein RRG08_056948 [Elysia crispata]
MRMSALSFKAPTVIAQQIVFLWRMDTALTALTSGLVTQTYYISRQTALPRCEFTSTKEKTLVKHVRKSHGKAAVRCPLCVGVHYSSSPEEFCVHKKQQHRSVRLRCFLCEFSSRSLDRWAGHVTRVHSGHTISLVSLASRIRSSSSQCFPLELRPMDVTGTFKNQHRLEKVCTECQGSDSHSPADCVLVENGHNSDPVTIRSEPGYPDLVPPLSPRFSCSVCGYSTSKQQNLRKHVTQKHADLKKEIFPHHIPEVLEHWASNGQMCQSIPDIFHLTLRFDLIFPGLFSGEQELHT